MIQKFKTRIEMIASLPKGSSIAEVGVWRGYFSNEILSLPNLNHVWLVDSWRKRDDYNDPLADPSVDHEANYLETLENIQGHRHGGRYAIMRMDSLGAAEMAFENRVTFDGVFLDAAHDYDSVLADLRAWSRVMSPSASIMGHDFCDDHPTAVKYGWGVQKAVAQFCKETDWKLVAVSEEEFPSFCLRKI